MINQVVFKAALAYIHAAKTIEDLAVVYGKILPELGEDQLVQASQVFELKKNKIMKGGK